MPAHGTSSQRGYGTEHQRLRRTWVDRVARGDVDCWRCHQPILPGTDWQLGHDDDDRTKYRGPEHAKCNLSAGAIHGNRRRSLTVTDPEPAKRTNW